MFADSPPGTDPADEDDAVDETAWDLVRDEIGGAAMCRYVHCYLELLPERLSGAESAAAAGQRSEAAKLLTDLHSSSNPLGAHRLAALAAEGAAMLRSQADSPAPDWQRLRAQADLVSDVLRRSLG